MNQQIYLDNAATTRMADEVRMEMEPYLKESYGNASTSYGIGADARKAIEKAREVIAETLHAKPTHRGSFETQFS